MCLCCDVHCQVTDNLTNLPYKNGTKNKQNFSFLLICVDKINYEHLMQSLLKATFNILNFLYFIETFMFGDIRYVVSYTLFTNHEASVMVNYVSFPRHCRVNEVITLGKERREEVACCFTE